MNNFMIKEKEKTIEAKEKYSAGKPVTSSRINLTGKETPDLLQFEQLNSEEQRKLINKSSKIYIFLYIRWITRYYQIINDCSDDYRYSSYCYLL